MEFNETSIKNIIFNKVQARAFETKCKFDNVIESIRYKVIPPIKGKITPGKLNWRGVSVSVVSVNPDLIYQIYQRGLLIDTNDTNL